MRTLFYVPIIHTSADLGSLAKEVAQRGIKDLGEEAWKKHEETVLGFWGALDRYFDSIEAAGAKIYQDGMIANGEIGRKIVEEGVKSGSKNYEVLSKLLQKGGILVKTEDFHFVREERNRLLKITQAETGVEKLMWLIRYKLTKNRLLNRRDDFISRRIGETLEEGETGIIFIGAYHHIKERLPGDIHIIEIKDIKKMREYHKLILFYPKNRDRIEELSGYLISEIYHARAGIKRPQGKLDNIDAERS